MSQDKDNKEYNIQGIIIDKDVEEEGDKEIEQNLLRPRAKRLPTVTDEMWNEINEDYREKVEEFIAINPFSPSTKKQYISALRQFGYFIKESLNNKKLYKIRKRDFMRYMTYLREDRKLSSSAQHFKKAAVSSLCNFIENVVVDDEEEYRNFRNFTRNLPAIPKNRVYSKEQVTYDEFKLMMDYLEEDENYLGRAWLATAFLVGARRAEIIQFKTEMLDWEKPTERKFLTSHTVRGKGESTDGKPLKFMIPLQVLDYWQEWVDHRGYEHEYIFTTAHNGKYDVMSPQWANYFCTNVLSNILGRRINPHIFKSSCITYHLENGAPMKLVSEMIAHHEAVETTHIYDLRSFDEERDELFDKF